MKIDRWLAHYLQRRGWICFWLDPESRYCSGWRMGDYKGVCWLKTYLQDAYNDPAIQFVNPVCGKPNCTGDHK